MAQATEDFQPGEVNYENEARAQGWRPKEEWSGEPERWVDAETFVTRAQNWSGHLKKELEEVKSLLRQQAALNKKHQESLIQQAKVREQELLNTISNLENQRAQAISMANGQQAVETERQIKAATEELKTVQEQAAPKINPNDAQAAADWRSRNSWYGTDKDLTKECDFIGNSYGQMHPDEPLSEVLDFTEKEMKRRHPELSGAPQQKPGGPQGNSQASGVRNVQQSSNTSGPKWEDLGDDERQVAESLIKRKVFKNRDAYLAAAAVDQNVPITDTYGAKKDGNK